MRAACREVQVLRTFTPPWTRLYVVHRLVRRYAAGRRSATDVCAALAALDAQRQHEDCGRLLLDAWDAVTPVPTVLWTWACRRADVLGCGVLRRMLRLAAVHARYAAHLRAHRDRLAASVDGVIALVHEAHRHPGWAPQLLRPALRAFMLPVPRVHDPPGGARSAHAGHTSPPAAGAARPAAPAADPR
jgi:hypothetical protein